MHEDCHMELAYAASYAPWAALEQHLDTQVLTEQHLMAWVCS